ncbi:hypothetical protein [Nitrosomonas aestuarii]|uniref:hypothetical protein n=1 Tax=Nitrosomonas aestuarii TaxID=52441 RepID=UPI000D31E6EF|nr:hypothetical protein [Nitrosomonas aestuarii]PTN12462.1 hypothetical protein C8R11_10327 [Nitrosomonas aestuarii]
MNLTTLKIATYLDIMDMLFVDARSLFTGKHASFAIRGKNALSGLYETFGLRLIRDKPGRVGNHLR